MLTSTTRAQQKNSMIQLPDRPESFSSPLVARTQDSLRRHAIATFIVAVGAMLLASTFNAQSLQAKSPDPLNIVFILADDLGWSDTTLYGTTRLYQTPNLERLAARGMTFSRAYANSPLCSPTRASILTGQTPARHGSTAPQHHTGQPQLRALPGAGAPPSNKAIETQSANRLDTSLPTLGKLIHDAGYTTGHFGKWHLGSEPYSPLQHGFDVDIPHHPGPGPAGSFVAPWQFKDFKANYEDEHIEDRMAEEAANWMKSVPDQPFFINYWQFSVHAPFDAKAKLIEQYRGKVDASDPQRSPTYAAMVHSFDDAIGTLLDTVDSLGIADRTVIIMASDNGGNMYNEVDGTTPTSNSPLRGGKATMFEGGVRVPCVVVWPGLTKPGSRSDEIIQTSDFYPTILNQLNIPLPANHVVDGIDITPALQGDALRREAIFTYFPHSPPVPDWLPPAISVHSGDWKLIRLFHQGEEGAHDYLLYHLADDIGEQNNLAAKHPDKVRQLDALIQNHIDDAKTVLPQPNPAFNPAQYRPEQIGIGKIRDKAANPSKGGVAKQRPASHAAGWVGNGTCKIRKTKSALVVESDGEDPYLFVEDFQPIAGGPFTVQIQMKSDAAGEGSVYFNKPFAAERTVTFTPQHDSVSNQYEVILPVERLDALRLDPARGPGKIEIESVVIENRDGESVQSWMFQ